MFAPSARATKASLLVAGLLAVILPLALPGDATFGPTSTIAVVDHMPTRVANHAAVFTGTEILVFGGSLAGSDSKNIMSYDPESGTSAILAPQFPQRRGGMAAVWTGEVAYLFGGTQSDRVVYVFDPAGAGGAGSLAATPVSLPLWREDMSAVWTGSKAYIFGGYTQFGNSNEILEFDPVAGTMNVLAVSLPTKLQHTSAVWDGTAAYIFGGTVDQGIVASNSNQIIRFTLPTATVPAAVSTLAQTMPFHVARGGAFWDGSRAYVIAGTTTDGSTPEMPRALNWIGEFDPATGSIVTWSHVLPYSAQLVAAVFDDVTGCAYVIGGEQRDDVVKIEDARCRGDRDEDGIPNLDDNCVTVGNQNQADSDGDGIGDACDPDRDGDDADNDDDNCPSDSNVDQGDQDGDASGDQCDPDDDNDDTSDVNDNCPAESNKDQLDLDGDTAGDVCDEELDGDGVANGADNCRWTANANQLDADHDGVGDACGTDIDGDNILNAADNCPVVPNPAQANSIHPSGPLGDACEDFDNDTIADGSDNCPNADNTAQADSDLNGVGDACEPAPAVECLSPLFGADTDGNGLPDVCVYAVTVVGSQGSSWPNPFETGAPCTACGEAYRAGEPVSFQIVSPWNPGPWRWEFGDGTSAVSGPAGTTHIFARPGNYVVTLFTQGAAYGRSGEVAVLGALPTPHLALPPAPKAGQSNLLLGMAVAPVAETELAPTPRAEEPAPELGPATGPSGAIVVKNRSVGESAGAVPALLLLTAGIVAVAGVTLLRVRRS